LGRAAKLCGKVRKAYTAIIKCSDGDYYFFFDNGGMLRLVEKA
jgi:hypothetical protein